MKKSAVKVDMEELVNKLQQQIAGLERKIDILVSRPAPVPALVKNFSSNFQQPAIRHDHGERRQGGNFVEKTMFKTICADCNKDCEVPFKPREGRPIYCKECFARRKSGNMPANRPPESKPKETVAVPAPEIKSEKPKRTSAKKPTAKKKAAPKKRKAGK